MATKVWLVSHAANAALRAGVFASAEVGDGTHAEALDTRALDAIEAWRRRWHACVVGDVDGGTACVLSSPAPVALASALAAGFADVRIESALADTAYGAWAGRRLIDIAQDAPDALAVWTRDPVFRPPGGGESFEDVRARVGAWLHALPDADAPIIAFTHASVIRAAVLHALGAPSATFRQLEIAPLSVTALRRSAQGWVWVAATA
ncbi:MAG TPA: histidine phosphatase family protein [Paraburkholderia sp.]|jgi:broad specificity phosphatase PhoE|uniref:histidine phosphatase family protein n=1 Tax=Paraburkholderia sp. TaxID=1926495 RepID=UPI002DEAF124|nr:histidine phosphatase family protein [Paraburkholderia sp.]